MSKPNPLADFTPDVPATISAATEARYGDILPPGRRERARLSPREAKFAVAYLEHGDPVQAMCDAGYDVVSRKLADVLLAREDVREVLDEQIDAITSINRVTHARMIAEHAGIAFSDVADYIPALTSGDAQEAFRALPREKTAAVRKLKVTRSYEGRGEDRRPVDTIELELHDKQKSLDALAKVAKLYETRDDGESDTPFGRLLERAMRKVLDGNTEGE